jgi:hypothetical protein
MSVCHVTLAALTPDGLRVAFASPCPLDMKWVEACITPHPAPSSG